MARIQPVSFKNANQTNAVNPFSDSFRLNLIESTVSTPAQSAPAQYQPAPAVMPSQDQFVKTEDGSQKTTKEKFKKALPFIISGAALASTVVMGVLFGKNKTALSNATKSVTGLQSQIGTLTEQLAAQSEKLQKAESFLNSVVNETKDAAAREVSKFNIQDIVLPVIAGAVGIFAGKSAPEILGKIKDAKKEEPFIVVQSPASFVDDGNNKTVSIWGQKNLTLKNRSHVNEATAAKITEEIAKAVNGETAPTPMKNPKIWSASYEGLGFTVGGQADIAKEFPVAANKEGMDVLSIAPLFSMKTPQGEYGLREDNGVLKYFGAERSAKDGVEVQKVYEGTLDDGAKFEAYYAPKGPHGQPTLYFTDNKYFNFGDVQNNNIYQNVAHSNERIRIAQFNNMLFEASIKAKEGKITMPDGEAMKAPQKMIAHEAWQSAGFLMKARLLSHALEADNKLDKESAQYIRGLADNTAVVVHNIGPGYQGFQMEQDINETFFNTLYGDYAHDIVYNSCINDSNDRILGLFGTPSQRLGFYKEDFRPAHAAVALATVIGPVSEGYVSELLNDQLGGDLTTMIKTKKRKGGLVPFPNGVDKEGLTASRQNVDKINKEFKAMGITQEVTPYLEKFDDDAKAIDLGTLMGSKTQNKKLFVELLQNQVDKESKIKIFGEKSEFYGGKKGIDLKGMTEKTPIFTMASRMDPQKGFDTAVDAYEMLMKQYKANDPNRPVLILSGSGENQEKLINYLKAKKDAMGEKGTRLLYTEQRVPDAALMLMNMTTTGIMPSDFEPYGISDVKVLYAGSHIICNEVGGMKAEGDISRKMYSLKKDGIEKANAITVDDYEYMCIAEGDVDGIRKNNAKRLANAMAQDTKLTPEQAVTMDRNALATDVSWDKGAVKNYTKRMAIEAA